MNQFRPKKEELPQVDEVLQEEIAETVKDTEPSLLKKIFVDGFVSKETATDMLPFLIFLGLLVLVYIGNSHMAIKNIRKIDKLSKEVKDLTSEYKSLKAELMFKSKMTEVAKKVDTLGLKELIEPPHKLVVER